MAAKSEQSGMETTPARQVVKKLQDSILTTCAADVQISGK